MAVKKPDINHRKVPVLSVQASVNTHASVSTATVTLLYMTVWAKTGLVHTCQYFEKYHFKNSIKNNQPCLGSGDIHWA